MPPEYKKDDAAPLDLTHLGLQDCPSAVCDNTAYSAEDYPVKYFNTDSSRMGGGTPGYITIGPVNKVKKSVRFWKNGSLEDEYPLGSLLIEFLDVDFSEYDTKRLELLEALRDEDFVKRQEKYFGQGVRLLIPEFGGNETIESMRTKLAYYFTYFGFGCEGLDKFYFPDHRYFYRRTVMDGYLLVQDTYETLLNFRADYRRMQEQIRRIARFCLYIDEPGRQSGLSARRLFDLGQANGLFSISTDLKYLMAGYFPQVSVGTFEPFSTLASRASSLSDPNEALLLLSESDRTSLYQQYADEKRTGTSVFGFSDGHPGSLAMVELMALIEQDARIRVCGICHRPFVLLADHDAMYCAGSPPESKSTCRKLGAARDAKLRDETPLKKAYRIRYKYYYDKVGGSSRRRRNLDNWMERAKKRVREAEADPSKVAETLLWLETS